jgi:Domain of unknown function (DUF5664)
MVDEDFWFGMAEEAERGKIVEDDADITRIKDTYFKCKYDAGKLPMNLVPPELMVWCAQALQAGLDKGYAADSWKLVPDAVPRYQAALLRHLTAYRTGCGLDVETKLPHLQLALINLVFLCWFELKAVQDE